MDASLRNYVEKLREFPALNQAQETQLIQRWRKHGDHAARNRLVQSHLGFVIAVARRYQRRGSSFVDIVAEANMGLLYAANKFDPEFGTRFATYAQYWVRVYASRCAIRAGATVPGSRSSAKVQREHARAQRLLGGGRAAIELAACKLGCTVEDVEIGLFLTQRRNVSFEALGAERHGAADPLLFARGPSPEQVVVEKWEALRTQKVVRSAISSLNARERRIVESRLMAEPDAIATLEQLGAEFGISRERVRQLEVRIKQKLSTRLLLLREGNDALDWLRSAA